MLEAIPRHEGCEVRQQLVQSLKAVADQIVGLCQAAIEAVTKDDIDAVESIGQDLEAAMRLQQSLMEQFRTHLQTHGCNAEG